MNFFFINYYSPFSLVSLVLIHSNNISINFRNTIACDLYAWQTLSFWNKEKIQFLLFPYEARPKRQWKIDKKK